jgi:tRNA(adenine34) deaminase
MKCSTAFSPSWTVMLDSDGMKKSLTEASKAAAKGEIPIGAVAVLEGKIIARAHNLRESRIDPLGHAELILISKISKKLKRWRLTGVTVYVTLEPCLMCMGALLQARVTRLVFGAFDPKAGACGSLYDLSKDARLNHRIDVTSGILAEECSTILKDFFSDLRKTKRRKT